jgi:hypothetical protein
MDMSLLQRIRFVWSVEQKRDQACTQIHHLLLRNGNVSTDMSLLQRIRFVWSVGQNLNPSISHRHLLHHRPRQDQPFMIFSAQANWHRTFCAGCYKS